MRYADPAAVKKWRYLEDLTQAECAERLGVTLRAWQRYEYGERRFPELLFDVLKWERATQPQGPQQPWPRPR